MEQTAARTPHYGIRKLSVGVASVLISTTLYMGAISAKADTLPSTAIDTDTTKPEATSSSSSTQANATADKTVETTTGVANNSTDTSVSTTPNAQASTTNTIAGATSSDKSGVNSNSLVANNVESTANTTAQAQQAAKDAEEKAKALAQAQQPKANINQSSVVDQWNQNPASKPTEKWKYESQSGPYYQQEVQQAVKDAEEKAKALAQAQQAAKDAEEKAKAQAQQAVKDAEEKAKAQVQQAAKDAEEKAKAQAQAKAEHTYFAKVNNGKVVDEKGHIMVGYSVKGNQVFDAQSKLVGTLAQTSTTRRMANTVKQENAKALPQTGEKQSKGTTVGAILVGLGSLLGLGALGKCKEK